MLRHVRSVLVRAPHVKLRHLRRLDDRIAAHLDGLAVAGRYGTGLCTAALERAGAGEVFALAVRVIDERDDEAIRRLVALAAALPDAQARPAVGIRLGVGVAVAGPGPSVARVRRCAHAASSPSAPAACIAPIPAPRCRMRCDDPAPLVRAAAWRAAGELGRTDLLDRAPASLADPDGRRGVRGGGLRRACWATATRRWTRSKPSRTAMARCARGRRNCCWWRRLPARARHPARARRKRPHPRVRASAG